MIFLDHNSTTKINEAVIRKINDAFQLPLNTSSNHALGRKANSLVEEARNNLRQLLNAQNYEVIFTSSSTEATNTVFFGTEVQEILFSKIEHSSVFNCRPARKKITEIDCLKNGLIDIEDLKTKIPSHCNFLVSAMHANNETGAIQPVKEIAKIIHQNSGLFHCDIVQSAGKIKVDLEEINADFASISAHKIQGPQGVGALLIRKSLEISPLILGSKQEKSKRAGTLNVAGISGFGEACRLAKLNLDEFQRVSELRNYLEKSLIEIAGKNIKIFAKDISRLANTSLISLKNISSQTQLINFDLNGICVSAGSACSSGAISESRILKAMNTEPEFLNSAIRVSLSAQTTRDEIESFISVWKKFYELQKF